MKFRNLQSNILEILGNEMGRIRPSGSFNAEMIYGQFSDIPAKAIKRAIDSLVSHGFIDIFTDVNELILTQKGVSHIETNSKNANACSFQLSPLFKQHVNPPP